MTTLKARFDGRVLVPEEPVDLPVDTVLEIQIVENGTSAPQNGDVKNDADQNAEKATNDDVPGEKSLLVQLAEISRMFPANPDTPTDLAAQHDHYLHGMPKRP